MLKIVKDKNRFRLAYYEFLLYNRAACTNASTIAKKTGLKLCDYIAVHYKHNAILEQEKLFFLNEEDAKNCYMDIAFDKADLLTVPEKGYFDVQEVDKGIYTIKRIYDYVHNASDLAHMAKLIKINKNEFINIIIENNGKMVSPDVYIFISIDDCRNCIEKLNGFSLGKAVMRKLIK